VVNPIAAFVYQTKRLLLFISRVADAMDEAPATMNATRRNSTEYVDVQENVCRAAWQRMHLRCRNGQRRRI
jgi:hypothetical protein